MYKTYFNSLYIYYIPLKTSFETYQETSLQNLSAIIVD